MSIKCMKFAQKNVVKITQKLSPFFEQNKNSIGTYLPKCAAKPESPRKTQSLCCRSFTNFFDGKIIRKIVEKILPRFPSDENIITNYIYPAAVSDGKIILI